MKTDAKPTVSVIVPVYNVECYIENCLNSLIAQTFKSWEAILVDDGSPDRSGDICEEFAACDPRFRVVHKMNGGQSSARNLAIPIANGEYYFFLDSDDYLHSDALQHLLTLANQSGADIIQCGYIRGSETLFPINTAKEVVRSYDNHSIFTAFAAKVIPWGKLYKRSVIGDIRFPEGLINEDDFTTWKFYYNAPKTVITSKPLYYYTINPNSTMANQKRKPNLCYFDAYRERISFFSKTNEHDLEAISRIQWMKSLVMLYSNHQLSSTERTKIKRLFQENYKSKSLRIVSIPPKLRFVFFLFFIAPMPASRLINKLYKH